MHQESKSESHANKFETLIVWETYCLRNLLRAICKKVWEIHRVWIHTTM